MKRLGLLVVIRIYRARRPVLTFQSSLGMSRDQLGNELVASGEFYNKIR